VSNIDRNGRPNQKTRTRKDLLQAAARLMKQGRTPTLEEVAEEALVSRATAYRYFPSMEALMVEAAVDVAVPEPAALFTGDASIDPVERLQKVETALTGMILANEPQLRRMRTGLSAIYAWYERHGQLLSCVLRDAEYHPLVREISQLRFGPAQAANFEVLGAKLNARQRALLQLALSFFTWRTLTCDAGLKTAAAVKAMADAIDCAGRG
jgi:AcrR family transcriptional regulator